MRKQGLIGSTKLSQGRSIDVVMAGEDFSEIKIVQRQLKSSTTGREPVALPFPVTMNLEQAQKLSADLLKAIEIERSKGKGRT